jgi:Arc/MetJ-type ribon-helix-helix transcriptional regulator
MKRPRPVKLAQLVQLRLTEEMASAIDDWRRTQADLPTRSEAIRRLLADALSQALGN